MGLKFLVVLCFCCVFTSANNCTAWHNCPGGCNIGDWSDTTIASIGRWASLNSNCDKAIDIMEKYNGVESTDRGVIHTSIQYLCCYSIITYTKWISVMENYGWESVNVTFDRAVCNMDNNDSDHTSIIVLMDQASQTKMFSLVAGFEQEMEKHGITVKYPRSGMEPFHVTLGVVNKKYPVDQVLAEINEQVPMWSDVAINISNFLLIPVPVWEIKSNDSLSSEIHWNDIVIAEQLAVRNSVLNRQAVSGLVDARRQPWGRFVSP